MKKLLLILMAFLAFAPPHLHAEEEEVFLRLSYGTGMYAPGCYSRKASGNQIKTEYSSNIQYSSTANNSTSASSVFNKPFTGNSAKSVFGFTVTNSSSTKGFTIKFRDNYNSDNSGLFNTTTGSLNALIISNNEYTGLLFFYHNENNKGLRATIESTNPQMPIKSIKIGKATATKNSQHISSFTTEDINKWFESYDDDNSGTWSLDNENYLIYTPKIPAQKITLKKIKRETGSSTFRLNYIGVTWDAPMEAPTINTTGLSTTPETYPYYNAEEGVYEYDSQQATIKINELEGASKILYTLNNTDPDVNSQSLPSNGGDVILPKAIPGQITELRARGIDSEGNLGMILTINCKRIAPTRPSSPKIRQFSQDFIYKTYNLATFNNQLTVADDKWEAFYTASPTIYLNGNELLLNFEQSYAKKVVDRYAGNNTVVEAKEAQLQYLINIQPTVYDVETAEFSNATIFECDEKQFPQQNHWLAISEKNSLHNGHALFANNSN